MLLTYITTAIVILIFTLWSYEMPYTNKERIRLGTAISLLFLVINIVYTSALGWNATPQSTLEWVLDIADAIFLFIGFSMILSEWSAGIVYMIRIKVGGKRK